MDYHEGQLIVVVMYLDTAVGANLGSLDESLIEPLFVEWCPLQDLLQQLNNVQLNGLVDTETRHVNLCQCRTLQLLNGS